MIMPVAKLLNTLPKVLNTLTQVQVETFCPVADSTTRSHTRTQVIKGTELPRQIYLTSRKLTASEGYER